MNFVGDPTMVGSAGDVPVTFGTDILVVVTTGPEARLRGDVPPGGGVCLFIGGVLPRLIFLHGAPGGVPIVN